MTKSKCKPTDRRIVGGTRRWARWVGGADTVPCRHPNRSSFCLDPSNPPNKHNQSYHTKDKGRILLLLRLRRFVLDLIFANTLAKDKQEKHSA